MAEVKSLKKYLISLGITTCLIILLTGFYIGLTNQSKIATLDYLPDGDWSKSSPLLSEVKPTLYDLTIDQTGMIHITYVEYNPQKMVSEMRYLAVDDRGKVVQRSPIIVSNKKLSQLTLEVYDDVAHVFWVGQGNGAKLDLFCTRLDLLGNKIETTTILQNEFALVQELVSTVSANGNFFFAWIDQQGERRQVKSLYLPDIFVVDKQPQLVVENFCLHLILESDFTEGYHLTWVEKKPKSKNEQASHDLYYQNFDSVGAKKFEALYIDRISPAPVGLAVDQEKVYLTWNKVVPIVVSADSSAIERLYPNYIIFGTVIDQTNSVQEIKIKRLTKHRGPSINQSIVADTSGQIHLVYIDTFYAEMGLTHQIYSPGFAEESKHPTRLYPDHRIYPQLDLAKDIDKTFLLKDPGAGIHLCWLDSGLEMSSLYHANTVNPEGLIPLQLVGINRHQLGINLLMSLGYILFFPFVNIFFFTHIFALAILTAILAFVLLNVKYQSKLYRLLKNPYCGTILICLIHQLFYKGLGISQYLFWPLPPNGNQMWFVYLLVTIVTLIFIGINRQKDGAFYSGMYVFYWLYWLNMSNLVFLLPQINF